MKPRHTFCVRRIPSHMDIHHVSHFIQALFTLLLRHVRFHTYRRPHCRLIVPRTLSIQRSCCIPNCFIMCASFWNSHMFFILLRSISLSMTCYSIHGPFDRHWESHHVRIATFRCLFMATDIPLVMVMEDASFPNIDVIYLPHVSQIV